MYTTIEVVERSKQGFPEAALEAVKKIMQAGEKVYYYEVIDETVTGEHRDAAREYQVTLKVAIRKK